MAGTAPFSLTLTGSSADEHQFQGYDGYMSLAGFAWVLSLSAHYVETGSLRQRGEFAGRDAVRGYAPRAGSVVVDFLVHLETNPNQIFAIAGGGLASATMMYAVVQRVLNRNFGRESAEADRVLAPILKKRSGDLEALVAISEAPLRQAHSVIGNGAKKIKVSGGFNIINRMDESTKEYVKRNVQDDELRGKNFSVSSFNANSGYGSLFDTDRGHNVPFSIRRDLLGRLRPVFSWGLDQYARGTGAKISVNFTSILSMDGRPKRYIVQSARIPKD